MKVTFELTEEQVDGIAAMVAEKLANRKPTTVCTVAQAAAQLGVHSETIRNRVKAGLLPKVAMSGVCRIPQWAIDNLLEGRAAK